MEKKTFTQNDGNEKQLTFKESIKSTWNTKDELLDLIRDNLFTDEEINSIVQNKEIVEGLKKLIKFYELWEPLGLDWGKKKNE